MDRKVISTSKGFLGKVTDLVKKPFIYDHARFANRSSEAVFNAFICAEIGGRPHPTIYGVYDLKHDKFLFKTRKEEFPAAMQPALKKSAHPKKVSHTPNTAHTVPKAADRHWLGFVCKKYFHLVLFGFTITKKGDWREHLSEQDILRAETRIFEIFEPAEKELNARVNIEEKLVLRGPEKGQKKT